MLFRNQGGKANEIASTHDIIKLLTKVFLLFSLFTLGFTITGNAPATGVVAQLLFNEGSGTTTSDGSGNSHTGTLTNGPLWTAGKYGQAINFDGTNDYVNIADHNNFTLDPAVSYTWSAWIRSTNLREWSTVFSQTINTSSYFYFYAHSTADPEGGPVTNGLSVYWWSNNTNRLTVHSTNNVLTAGQWTYVTVTYDAAQAQNNRFSIYVNGADVTARNDVSSVGTIATLNPTNIRVASNQPYGEYFSGAIDEVRYYRRLLSAAEIISDMNTGATGDTQAPTVSVTAPATGSTVSGTTTVTAAAADNVGVSGVQFLLDGVALGAEDVTSPYSVSWTTTTATNGSHTLTARARDAAGNTTTSATTTVTVNNADTQAPTVSITAPTTGSTVSGTTTVTATAADNVGVSGVQFLLDGVALGAEDVTSPYSVSWITTTATNGSHTLTARARDAAGNTTTSATITVTVNNADTQAPTVSVTAPAAGSIVSATTTLTATASDNIGVVGVQFLLDGVALGTEVVSSPYSVSWTTTTATNGSHTLTARARDAAGNTTVSAAVSVTVNNISDIEIPTVNVTAPIAGSTVSGTTTVTATASDNTGIAGVQFLLDGVPLGAEDVSSPYSVSWTTTTATNGSHTITARARDAAGNTATSTGVSITVFNTSLVAAYAFSENAGTIANDNSGNGNTGTLTNGPTWSASGKYGAAVLFDGTNDLVSITDANSLDLTTGMTLEAWINPSNLTGYKTLLSKENGTNNLAYALSANNSTSGTANQRPNSRIRIGSNIRTVTGITKLTLNTWTHIASTYDGTTMRLYINGVQVSTFATTGNITATTNLLYIGGSPALGAQYFTGLIDEVRIYNRALTQTEIQTDMNTPIAPDITAPVVSITAPANGSTVSGTLNVTAAATDNISVTGVQFLLDGNNLGTEDLTSPYSVSWNTTTIANGSHILTARARDAAGNITVSGPINVTVNNDSEAPSISITSPTAGSTVSGTIDLTADANDNTGVIGVQFLVDGVNAGSEDVTAPYSFSWNTTLVTDGSHTVSAKARDAAGNTTTSIVTTVSVLNIIPDTEPPTVSIISPAGDATVSGTTTVTATAADNISVSGVQFLLDGVALGVEDLTSPYSVSWNTLTASNGSHTLTARARDAAGNNTVSSEIIITVDNDNEPPVISISSPATGNVAGTIDIIATASDNKGITGVQFLVDNVNLGAEVLTAPYSVSWNTTAFVNGGHSLTAKARDAAGNTTTSAVIVVNVNNADAEPPVIAITTPAAGNVSGSITVTANATDNIGVVGVQFLVDGNNISMEDLTAPYSVSWNTINIANGSHTLTARARDAAGNITTSANVNITVSNDTQAPAVSITSPASGFTVSGSVNVTANASDDIGVVGVQFLLDGINLGAEDLIAPYSISWATTAAANGSHILTAKARDAAGNSTTSTPIAVVVSNATNLISAHHFNEGTGTTASDISGNNHNGTLTNGPLWVAGKYGQAVSLDGTNDYVNIADHNNFTLDPAQSYTWSAWVKNNSFKEWSTVWSQTINTSTFFYFYAHTSTDPDGGPVTNGVSVYWWSSNSTRLGAHSLNNVLTIGVWSHIAITYDASQPQNNRFTIYVNGIDVTVRNDVSSVGTITNINPGSIRIGANLPFGEYFNGAIDDVRYYKRLLIPSEVISDMNTALGVDNTSPVVNITSPSGGSSVSGSVNVTATATDNFGVAGVQFLLDGINLEAEDMSSPFSVSWNTSNVTNGNHVLSARARDAAGNITTSAGVNVTVNNDTEPPTTVITSPANGAVLIGTVDITANAIDNLTVAGVQFLLNGVSLGSEDLSAPYTVSWRTTTVANGTYTLTARARDAAGNTTISTAVNVIVDNIIDTESPLITITSPSAGNVSGTITFNANASDNVGVEGVQFLLDGSNLGAEDITAPYSFIWNSALAANGNHVLSARARDAAGNTATAVEVNVVITNTTPVTISGVTVSSITESSAIITWTTNIPANSQIYYGTTTGYGLSTLTDPALVTTHSMILNGLTPATLYHYQAASGNLSGISATSPDNVFTTASLAATLGTLNGHTVNAYPAGKPVPWTPNPADGYMTVVSLAWNYLLNTVPNDPLTGKPAYYSRSYINPNTQQMVDWPHNPAGLFGMLIESAIKYYNYSGDANVMKLAEDVALWHLDHGMTTATDNWPSVPYSAGQFGSLNYGGALQDGVGNLEPDKIGELGYGWLQLYRYNGNTRLRDAAIQAGNVLASKVRTGTMNQSPWPFRVKASNGSILENYGSNIIGPVSLLDGLIADGLGNTAAYQAARTTAWNWMMLYPMQNNIWTQYFEDVGIEAQYDHNLNQYNPMMVARYLLEHPEMDPNWEAHVRGLITWVETVFGQTSFGALAIREQTPVFALIMGSHTSRYASVNALLYERTGDLVAKERAYRSFNWSTYMARPTGVVIDGPDVNNQWFTDGYGDYVRHFMTGVGAVPEWTPANETHLLRSTSVVKNISYGVNSVNYTTYNANAVDVLHINFNPFTITADGVVLQQRSDLSQPGWTLDVATKALRIYHNNATQISISWAGTPSFITKNDLHINQSQERQVNSFIGQSDVSQVSGKK